LGKVAAGVGGKQTIHMREMGLWSSLGRQKVKRGLLVLINILWCERERPTSTGMGSAAAIYQTSIRTKAMSSFLA
jgi:hypothetical protein